MESEKSVIHQCYQLMQKILQDAFNVQTILFTPPYEDFKQIDQGIRAVVWTNYDTGQRKDFFGDHNSVNRILVIRSNLGFYNIMVTFKGGGQPEFISVGPFRENELTANYFTQILKESHITTGEIQRLKYMYERMPMAVPDTVLNVMNHVLAHFIPEFAEVIPENIQFTEQNRMIDINNELLDNYSVEYSEKYKSSLFEFLQYIKEGDNRKAKEAMHKFLQETKLMHGKNMREYKMMLQLINDYCHVTLLETSIHPLHIIKQTASIKIKIEETASLARLEQMPNEICHKYCLLVKNYANPECSRLIKDVMTYIQLHMEEELSLSYLAAHFNKNATTLSNIFSKEIGISITGFIQHCRVQAALKLFNTTDMSVAEVATAVGYQDFSYFSKIFSKHVGCSPRAYKTRK